MAIRALPALLLILFLPHLLEASEADYIDLPNEGDFANVDYSGIEISQSYAIQLAITAMKQHMGVSTLPYTQITAEKFTVTRFPEAYYDLEPGDDGGYTSFKVTYWNVGFKGGPNLSPDSVSVHARTGEATVEGPQVDHFDASELRHGAKQTVKEKGEWSLPVVKKSNETCVMVCNFDIPRYEAAQRAHDKARAVVEGTMGNGCCDPSDNINHIILDATGVPGSGEHRYYYPHPRQPGESWVIIDHRVADGDIEDVVAHELGHYYQVRVNPYVFVMDSKSGWRI